jgi:hypothetical protein
MIRGAASRRAASSERGRGGCKDDTARPAINDNAIPICNGLSDFMVFLSDERELAKKILPDIDIKG